ncbi:SusC/RagA family TonB-linked outer membrane protein [Bacteroides finegoldii]|uniref:Outer membrane receptor proteins, mostly Fe transport n=2 Tax=Bacteroides finegoldii TaxID=338188 RepID=A0A173ZKK5_9BACE|nr:TonB-dependent receptor [Bacteroides finegoldii]CUN76587.1 Outer membrane receptor proteins%2C mostly Fe transport [Bacteroides finegoldii]
MNRVIVFLLCFLTIACQAFAQGEQSFTLTGTVFDEFNEPVPGANVYVKNKPGVGVTTDIDGKYHLKVSIYDIIVVSFLGYENFEQRLTKKLDDLKVTLKPSTEHLDEVVVVGMGTQRKVSVAGAITTMEPAQLEVPATNIVNTLAGRVAGVIGVQSSGEPGKNISEFWVRGIGTFGASSGALVLIDGLEGDLSQVDAADVESFSVLKDAAATAVYGSRGANGVVLVTTKRGLESKLKITGRANLTISHLKRLPDYVDGAQYAELANEAAVASNMSPIYNSTEMDIIRYGLDPDLYPNIDWQDVILNPNSFQQTYYVSAQGGSSVARYFASLGMSQESSAYKAADDSKYNKGVGYNTYNYRLNLDVNLTKTTKVYVGATGYMSVNNYPSMGKKYDGSSLTDWLWSSQAKTTPLSYPLRYSDGKLPASAEGDDISPYVLLNYTGSTKVQNTRNLVTVGVTQDLGMLTKGLTAKIQGSWDNQSRLGESRYKMPSLWMATGRNNQGELLMSQRVNEVSVDYSNLAWTWRKLYFEANVNYDRAFGDHRLGGLLFYYLEDTQESGADSSMNAIPKRYQSLSGRFTYGFKDTYFLDLNFGLNGSENFEPGKQYGFFPAAALAWVPTSYEFIQDKLPWMNFFKLRFSYGTVGNDRISNRRFPYLTLIKENSIESDKNSWGGTEGTLTESQVGANNLVWEKAKKLDLGMDMHLFDDKLTLTLDYFNDKREAIFQERTQIPSYVGLIQMPYGNVGSMKSWGADGNFEFFQKLGKDAHVTLRGNFTLSKNKILNWEEANQPYPYLEKNGYANNVQRGFISLGLFKDQQDVDMSPEQFGKVRPGDIKYKDVNGDGKITNDDQVPLFAYSGVPQLMYGFGAEFNYKNWTLNVLFKGTGRNKFLYGGMLSDRFDGYIPFNNGAKGNVLTIAYDQNNRWTSAEYSGNPTTENPNARFPRLYYGKNENNTKPSTFWLGDARYLRLQELSLSYNMKVPALQRVLGIQSMDIRLMCENLAVWDSVDLFDPEQATACGQSYPLPARYSLQLYLNF